MVVKAKREQEKQQIIEHLNNALVILGSIDDDETVEEINSKICYAIDILVDSQI